MNLSVISLCAFMALNALLAWGVALLLWRRIGHRRRGVHVTVATTAAIAFAFGAAWFNVVHVWTFEPVPDNVPQGNNSRFGLVIFAGFAGILLLVLATVIALAGYALWGLLSRRHTDGGPNRPRP